VILGAANTPAAVGIFLTIALILLALVLYFAPSIVAAYRHHTQWGAIFALNLFLGWTFFGWVGALIWACASFKYMPSHPAQQQWYEQEQWRMQEEDRRRLWEQWQQEQWRQQHDNPYA
jgi:hypothetical protein